MAKKSNLVKVGDAISQFLKQEKLDVRISQFSVKNAWKDIAGDMIARNTSDIFFNGKTIFISLSSAALKHELSFRKEDMLLSINKFCGYQLVDEIVIR
jgi:predicted nucleic acid-binding Zn ribbon protein